MPLSLKPVQIISDPFTFHSHHLKTPLYCKPWQTDLGGTQGWQVSVKRGPEEDRHQLLCRTDTSQQ